MSKPSMMVRMAQEMCKQLAAEQTRTRLALGFPVIRVGTRTLIPREGFVRFCRAQHLEETARWH